MRLEIGGNFDDRGFVYENRGCCDDDDDDDDMDGVDGVVDDNAEASENECEWLDVKGNDWLACIYVCVCGEYEVELAKQLRGALKAVEYDEDDEGVGVDVSEAEVEVEAELTLRFEVVKKAE